MGTDTVPASWVSLVSWVRCTPVGVRGRFASGRPAPCPDMRMPAGRLAEHGGPARPERDGVDVSGAVRGGR